MHKAISTKVQGKTCFETKLNKVDQTFWFLIFYVFLDFWHKIKKKLIKKNNVKTFKNKNKQTTDFQLRLTKSKQPSIVTQHKKY